MLLNFKLFVEAKLANLATFIGKEIPNLDKEFDDQDFISTIKLDKYNKTIKVDWNNTVNHNLKDKIKNRSQIISISEFNEIFENIIKELFYDRFDEIEEDIDTYDLFLTESKIHILVILNYRQLFKDKSNIFVLTILPNQPINTEKILEFEY